MTRREISGETSFGKEIMRRHENKEGPYPPRFLYFKMHEAISRSTGGFILDGYPKHPGEVPEVKEIMDELSVRFTGIVHVKIGLEEAIERANGRICCNMCDSVYNTDHAAPKIEGRCDGCTSILVRRVEDTPENVAERYKGYQELTVPAIEMLKDYNDGYFIELENPDKEVLIQSMLNAENPQGTFAPEPIIIYESK